MHVFRLYLLLKSFVGQDVAEYSGALTQKERDKIILHFNQKKIKMYEVIFDVTDM